MTRAAKWKKFIVMVLSVFITAIGVFMAWNYSLPTPPSLSGWTFIMTGLALWVPNCKFLDHLFTEKK